jgi:hypothetical protein
MHDSSALAQQCGHLAPSATTPSGPTRVSLLNVDGKGAPVAHDDAPPDDAAVIQRPRSTLRLCPLRKFLACVAHCQGPCLHHSMRLCPASSKPSSLPPVMWQCTRPCLTCASWAPFSCTELVSTDPVAAAAGAPLCMCISPWAASPQQLCGAQQLDQRPVKRINHQRRHHAGQRRPRPNQQWPHVRAAAHQQATANCTSDALVAADHRGGAVGSITYIFSQPLPGSGPAANWAIWAHAMANVALTDGVPPTLTIAAAHAMPLLRSLRQTGQFSLPPSSAMALRRC